jgi:hypothetical protein
VALGPGDPMRKTCGDGQRMGTTARSPDHRETVKAQRIGNKSDVLDAVRYTTTTVSIRGPVAGSVVGDDPGSRLAERYYPFWPVKSAPGGAVKKEDRWTVEVAPLFVSNLASVRCLNLVDHLLVLAPTEPGLSLNAGTGSVNDRGPVARQGWLPVLVAAISNIASESEDDLGRAGRQGSLRGDQGR